MNDTQSTPPPSSNPAASPGTGFRKSHRDVGQPPFECVALLLQGGGALGAYQGGVYQALAEAELRPDWVAGISIGAINCAIIAGNPPESGVARLREFWELVSDTPVGPLFDLLRAFGLRGDLGRSAINQLAAGTVLLDGVDGFFKLRVPSPLLQPVGSIEATSFYSTAPLKTTLEKLIDFDRLNAGAMRCSVGATNVRTGNFVYFDTKTHYIGPEHIMASGALPPGFPAVEIDGEHYWDGGLVSNTPLQFVLQSAPRQDTLAFQVDLWSARGEFPRDISDVSVRMKEIQYSSRTRASTDAFRNEQKLRRAISALLEVVPEGAAPRMAVDFLASFADHKVYNIIELIYRSKHYEGTSKDYEFSRRTMEDHWRCGYQDAVRTLRHPEVFRRPHNVEGVSTFDVTQDGRE